LQRSSSIAEAFLSGGVANFLGTHWPVNDADAATFAQSLYGSLLRGSSLGTAILKARRLILAKGSPNWADYVHYGNPAFFLARRK
jgi:CHAT domain-containing protein